MSPSMPLYLTRTIEYGSEDYQAEVRLRSKVLREPLGLSFTPEELAPDSGDIHLGLFSGPHLVGCLILAVKTDEVVRMRQVAIDPSHQGTGAGRRLVQYSEEIAIQRRFSTIELNARESAVPFYTKLGYESYGEAFVEVTLPHRKMRKTLRR